MGAVEREGTDQDETIAAHPSGAAADREGPGPKKRAAALGPVSDRTVREEKTRLPKGAEEPGQAPGNDPALDGFDTNRSWSLGLRGLGGMLRALYMIGGVAAIFSLSYIFGHRQLEGFLSGNDIPFALGLVEWYDRWFPSLPIWYPLQGAGTPFTILYPLGTSLIAVVIRHLTGLTVIQAFRLLGFLSIPLTATGIYFLVWSKLRSQTAALLAGLFYPLSSASWAWLVQIGLYGQVVSIMFVPWTFLFFDAYLSRALSSSKSPSSLRDRMTFPAAALLFALLFIVHPSTAVIFAMGVSLYALMLPFLHSRRPQPWRLLPASLLRGVTGVFAGLALAAVWLLPLIHANALANREGLSYIPWNLVSYFDFAATLGITPPPP